MAQEAYDFYAYWNGEAVADLWSIIAAMTATDDYRVLLSSVILLGFLLSMLAAALRNRGADALTWFAATVVILSIAFIPRVNILVKDVRAGYAQAVENIPIGIAWPASVTSRVSWWLTETFETAFNDVDAARYSRFGVAFPQRAVTAMMAMGAVTERGQSAVRAVAERCIIPEILDNPAKREALLTSGDITGLITSAGWVNPARRVLMNEELLSCKDALPKLAALLETTEIPEMEKVLVAKLDASGNDLAAAGLLTALPGAEEMMLGVSRSLSQSLKQSVMLSALPDAMLSSAAKAGKAPLTTGVAIARAQGNLASEINYRALSDMAKSALPKVRNVLEFVVIALFPIVFILMAGMGMAGMTVVRSYMTLLISVGLWAPITAIINYLTIHVDADPINRLVEASGGVTMAAASLIREAGASSQAMAGSLMWLVPVLAYAVAKGSDMAVTQMASSVLAPAASAAQAQGSTIAMGNVSAGNASVGNVSANNMSGNKTDMSSSYTSHEKHQATSAFGSYQGTMATGAVTAMSVARNDLGIDTSGSYSKSVESSQVSSNSRSNAFFNGQMRNDTHSFTGSEGVTGSLARGLTTSESTVHSDGTTSMQSSQYGTVDSVGNSATLNRSGNSTESIGANSTAGWMVNNLYKDNPTSTEITSIENSTQTAEGISNPIPAPNMSGFNNFTQNALPTKSGSESRNRKNGFIDSGNLGSRFNVNTQAGLSDTVGLGLNTSSNTNIQVTDASTNSYTSSIQKSIIGNQQAGLNHQQTSNFSDTKSDSSRSETSRSHENRDAKNFSDSFGASTRTGVDMSTRTRDEALRIYGGPEAALEALSSSVDQRLSFGRHMKSISDQYRFTDNMVGNPAYKPSIPQLESRALEQNYQADARGVEASAEHSFESVNSQSAVQQGEVRIFRPAVSNSEMDLLHWNRGLTIAAAAQYQQDETGALSVGSRSYLFGLTYDSPQQFYSDLRRRSEVDPEFKSALIEMGRDFNSRGQEKTIETKEILDRLMRKN